MKHRVLQAIVAIGGAVVLGANCAPLAAQQSIAAMDPAQAQLEDSLVAALDTIIAVNFNETPLSDGIAEIGRQVGAPIAIDDKKLDEASVSLDRPVTFASNRNSARGVLSLLLRPLELGWAVRDGVVVITTKEDVDQTLITRVYPVLDLTNGGADSNSLINVLTDTVAPTSWDEVGGPGSVAPLRVAGSLVISQTRDAHEDIAALLTALRVARDRQGLPAFPRAAPASAAQQAESKANLSIAGVSTPDLARRKVSSSQRRADVPRYSFPASAGWQRPQTHE